KGPVDLFADFRGFAFPPPLITQPLKQRENRDTKIPSYQARALRRSREIDDGVLSFVEDRPNFFAAAFAFAPDDAETVASEDANAVLCGVLDGAAVYGSALGKQTSENEAQVRYFV